MVTLKSCPVCDSDHVASYKQVGLAPQVLHEIMPGVKVEAAIITRYSQCQNCGLIFQNPRLSDSELDKFYSQGYYRRTLNLTDEHADIDEKYRAQFDAEIIKRHVGSVTAHLDIGCARGYLLEAIRAKIKVGVDTDVKKLKVKGVKLYSKLRDVKRKSFDLVTAVHTLEHEPSPLEYLKNMTKFVGERGNIVLEVPTWKSPGGPLRLAHLYHFESSVLRHLCALAELQIIHEQFTPHLMLICHRT